MPGKGVAGPASEVKSLSSQTDKATEDSSSQIGLVQEATRRAVHPRSFDRAGPGGRRARCQQSDGGERRSADLLTAVPAIDAEVRIGGKNDGVRQNLAHSPETRISEAHRHVGIFLTEPHAMIEPASTSALPAIALLLQIGLLALLRSAGNASSEPTRSAIALADARRERGLQQQRANAPQRRWIWSAGVPRDSASISAARASAGRTVILFMARL
jgi:hypothetical protein